MQMEFAQKHAAFQLFASSGCRECLSLALVSEGKREDTCMWCDQVDDQPGGRAYRGSKKAEGCQGVRERNRLVESHPSIPERNAAYGTLTRVRRTLTLLLSCRTRGQYQQ